MKRLKQGALATCALGVFGLAAMAAQGEWRSYFANDPRGRNVVVIESRAPLETIVTTTSNVVGEIKVNPDNILDNPQVRFELDLASMDTGIDVRNEHMRGEAWLNTEKFPKTVFTLTKLSRRVLTSISFDNVPTQTVLESEPIALKDFEPKPVDLSRPVSGSRVDFSKQLRAEGILEMRGVKRPITAVIDVNSFPATEETATRLPGDLLHIRTTFPIKLDDFGINVPATAQLKVANVQQVTVDIFTSTGSDAPKFASVVAEADKPSTVVKKPVSPSRAALQIQWTMALKS